MDKLSAVVLGLILIVSFSVTFLNSAGSALIGSTESNFNYAGADGHTLKLVNNPNATNVTYAKLVKFIDNDTTDQIKYTNNFQCADYAEKLHNNAEAVGIKCGFVAITFLDHYNGHACNVFDTTDHGRIFVDTVEADKTVDVQTNKDYTPISMWNVNKIYYTAGCVQRYDIFW